MDPEARMKATCAQIAVLGLSIGYVMLMGSIMLGHDGSLVALASGMGLVLGGIGGWTYGRLDQQKRRIDIAGDDTNDTL